MAFYLSHPLKTMASSPALPQLDAIRERWKRLSKDKDALERDSWGNPRWQHYTSILKDACALVVDADKTTPRYPEILAKVDDLINDAVSFGYGEEDLFEHMPSFAHSDSRPLAEGRILDKEDFPDYIVNAFLPFVRELQGLGPNDPVINPKTGQPLTGPAPWEKSSRPHALTSKLSRFKTGAAVTATSATPLATNIVQARCEIQSDPVAPPLDLSISGNSECMIMPYMAGWKERVPYLAYYFLDEMEYGCLPNARVFKLGLEEGAFHSIVAEQRKLMFVADSSRVKSYAWGPSQGGRYENALPTHTMDSAKFEGPLAILSQNRLFRAGKGSVAVWDLDAMPTHGPKGEELIGESMDAEKLETWRDDQDEIELSKGASPTATFDFEIEGFSPGHWTPHPSLPSNMICGFKSPRERDDGKYSCISFDMEYGGKYTTRFLGHGGDVTDFSTSDGDRSVFASACSDGVVRLYDVREPLPMLSLDAGMGCDSCTSVVLIHPDGIPTVFSGLDGEEQIKVWDIRVKGIVYELSTGNTQVVGLAWDHQRSALYAATHCPYIDRQGHHFEYQRVAAHDEDDEAGDEGNGWWPKRARHGESYFGHRFDAAEHSLLRYAFKENPDASVLPTSGYVSGSHW